MTEITYARCESCEAAIDSGNVEGETPPVCPNCGERGELVSVIEDSTDRGFDPTAYYDP